MAPLCSGPRSQANSVAGKPRGDVLVHGDQKIEIRRRSVHVALHGETDRDQPGADFARQRIVGIARQIDNREPEPATAGDSSGTRDQVAFAGGIQRSRGAPEDICLLVAQAAMRAGLLVGAGGLLPCLALSFSVGAWRMLSHRRVVR